MHCLRGRRRVGALAWMVGLWMAINIQPAIGQTIIINQLEDFSLGTWSGSGNMVLTLNHCVGPTSAQYRITARGSGSGGAFTLTNGISQLAYSVQYAGRTGGFATLTAGVPRTGLAGDTRAQCTGLTRESERLRITITAANLTAATAGTYSGSLTLTVAPE